MRSRIALGLALVVIVSAALRVYQVRQQPIFMDEDLYTAAVLRLDNWSPRSIGRMAAQVVKPPLPLLSQAILTRAIGDVVLAGRLISAASGITTTLLTYFLGKRLSGGQASAGIVAAAVYALSPVAVLHERLVLHDGLLTAAALGAVLVSWSAVERGDLRRAAVAAAIGFIAVQMKLPGVVCAAAPVLILLLNAPINRQRAVAAAVSAMGPLASYAFLRLSPLGPFLDVQDQARLELLGWLQSNFEVLWDSARTYVPLGVAVLAALGAIWMARNNRAPGVVVLVMIGLWVVPWVFISNFAPSRYQLPAVPYLAALAGAGAAWLVRGVGTYQRWFAVLASTAVVIGLAVSGARALAIATDLPSAQLSQLDDWQYRSGWPAGGVYGQAAELVTSAAAKAPIDARVYMIDPRHQVGAGAFDAESGRSWLVLPGTVFPSDASGQLLVMVDMVARDGAGQLVDQAPGQHVELLREIAPGAALMGFFPAPPEGYGVAVLRITR